MSQLPFASARAHTRQFVIDRCVRCIGPDWRSLDLVDGYVLSHCADLRVHVVSLPGGVRRVLIGHAYQARPDRVPAEQGLEACGGDLTAEAYGWAGRWIVISEGLIFGDVSNSLGLFYRRQGDEFLVSSSLAILDSLCPGERLTRRRYSRCGINWTPPPGTRIEGVRKLLPDQAIDLRAGSIRRVEKSGLVPGDCLDASTAGSLLLAALERIWKQLAKRFPRIRLALTGGYDSRTLMAAGLSAGTPFDAVTLEHSRITIADRSLPPALCRHAGVAHRYVRLARHRPELERLYDQHTFREIDEADRDFWRRDMFHWLDHGDCLVRGAAFELGRLYYQRVFDGLSWEAVTRDPILLARRFKDFASLRLESAQLAEWIAWRVEHPASFDWTEMFYLDQRMCGWAAAGEQGLDLLRGTSINPANCSYIIDILRRADPSARIVAAHQFECIRQTGTGLDRFPINPRLEGFAARSAARLREIAHRAANEGANLLGI